MSNSHLVIKYRDFAPALAKRVVPIGAAMLVSSVALALFGPFSNPTVHAVWMSVISPRNQSDGGMLFSNLYLTASCAVTLLCLGFRKFCQTTSIVITPDEISLPDVFAVSMKFRLRRPWSDVSQASILTKKGRFAKLAIYFRSGGRAVIWLDSIDAGDLERLILALQMRVEDTAKTEDLEGFLDYLHQKRVNQGELSFTYIWEQDMNQRFAAVAFVPIDPGQTLQSGKLKIMRQIAFGGLSAVYLAQRNNGDRVIVKEAALPSSVNPTLRSKAESMLKREADFLMRLSHPQIVKMLDCFLENGKTYLVLEQVPGQTLRQIVREKGPVAESLALNWMHQLAAILSYLHAQNPPIVHKDLSPDNIIVGPDGKLVLIDFGIANELISTVTGTLAGKRAYISPEQFKGKATRQSDIYALGATLYFALTGHDPEPLSVSHPKDLNRAVSAGMDELVAQCTSLDSEGRVANAQALLDEPTKIELSKHLIPEALVVCKQTTV